MSHMSKSNWSIFHAYSIYKQKNANYLSKDLDINSKVSGNFLFDN